VRTTVLAIVVVLCAAPACVAQEGGNTPFCTDRERRAATLDTRGLGALYCTTPPGLARSLGAVHRSARPVFYGAVPLAWGAAFVRGGDDYTDAFRLTVAQGGTYGLVLALKHVVGRPRPFVTRALTSRSGHYGPDRGGQYHSFPSGHASISAAIVTSWSLSYPRWYVVAPGVAWAAGVSLSRLYLGVHYPSDVLVGAALGVGVAVLVHQVRATITPPALRGEGGGLPVGVTIRF